MERVRPHLGTFVAVRANDAPDPARAIEAAFAAISRVERLMSCHQPESELARLNRTAHLALVRVDPWTYSVLRLALQLYRDSHGAFDCTVGGRQAAEGRLPLHGGEHADREGSSADIELSSRGEVRYLRKLHIDMGGIAKGFAVDRAVDAMRRAGAASGIVNAGGDLRAFGAATERVHVRLPRNRGLVPVGDIRDAAVATSSSESNPPLGLRLLDGRSRRLPALRVVSVFASRCAVADGLAKIVALQGPRSRPLLQRFGAEALYRVQASGRWLRIGAQAA